MTLAMQTFDLQAYGDRLYQRRDSGVIAERVEIVVGDWAPLQNRCHENATVHCELDPSCEPVRGWLFFDFGHQLPYVQFTAHSVVRRGDGVLMDITPAQTFQMYPFIQAEEGEDEYAALIELTEVQYLQYEPATKNVSVFGSPLGQ
jgi:hypothetical protein